jgi:hypothetical protein
MRSAAFSPIMIEGRVGIAAGYRGHDRGVGDAQTFDSIDAQLRIDDAHGVDPHFAGSGLVVVRLASLPHPFDTLRARLCLRPHRALAPFGEGRTLQYLDRDFERMDEGIEVGRLAEIARIEMERRRRIVGGELKFAARDGPNDAGRDRIGARRDFKCRQRRRLAREQRLVIGHREPRIAFGEDVGFEDVVLRRRNVTARFVDDEGQKVIVEVLADAAQIGLHLDAELF